MESKLKYQVIFNQDGNSVVIAELPDDVSAVQFAINLHRSSNIKHSVFIRVGEQYFVTFTLK